MSSESWFWNNRVKNALAGLDPQRIEDRTGLGVPDVNCVLGDIELKWVEKPGRRDTVFMRGALRPAQRAWLWTRWKAGGSAWCLIGVGREEFILLSGAEAALRMDVERYTWAWAVPRIEHTTGLSNALQGKMFQRQKTFLDRHLLGQ